MSSIEDEVIDHTARAIAAEIDFEVLSSILIESSGWVKVVLSPMTGERGSDIDHWCDTQVKGHFMNMGLVWVFEDPKEANWFTLRWLA